MRIPLAPETQHRLGAYMARKAALDAELRAFATGLLIGAGLDPLKYHLNVTKGCLEPIPKPPKPAKLDRAPKPGGS